MALRSALALLILFATTLGWGAAALPAGAAPLSRAERVDRAVTIAREQIGDPYVYGAAGPRSFDCSGLVYYSMRKAGFTRIPRTSSAQATWGRPVSKSSVRRGDLVFFHHHGSVYHAAIFLRWSHGQAIILHSPRPGERVQVSRAWTSEWFARTAR